MMFWFFLGCCLYDSHLVAEMQPKGTKTMCNRIFFSRRLDDFVLDAVCECGHLERDHGSHSKNIGRKKLRLHDGGNCCVESCGCHHFRWARWLTATEFAQNLPAKQEDRLFVN